MCCGKTMQSLTDISCCLIYWDFNGLCKTSVLARIAMALDTTSEYLMEGVPQNYVDEIGYAKRLIARNVNQMSNAEKREILSILLGDEEG